MQNWVFGLVLLALGCSQPKNYKATWLVGDWIRINGDSTVAPKEHWRMEQGTLFGYAYSINDGDTIFSEKLKLEPRANKYLMTISAGGEESVSFTSQDVKDNLLTVENQQHDFPKTIQYKRHQDTLMALACNEKDSLWFTYLLITQEN
mgnify:CR=1 FL=1